MDHHGLCKRRRGQRRVTQKHNRENWLWLAKTSCSHGSGGACGANACLATSKLKRPSCANTQRLGGSFL